MNPIFDGRFQVRAAALFLFLFALPFHFAPPCAAEGLMGQEVKGFNRIFLHDDPQPGDYALYENQDGTHQMRREIVAVHGDTVEIRTTFPKTPAIIASMRDLSFRSTARRDGTVLEAYMENARTGTTTRLALAGPGDYNYVDESAFVTLPVPETITTRKGSFVMEKVLLFKQTMSMLGVQSNITSVWYYDRKVKFGLVRQHNIVETDASIVEVAAFINRISPIPQLYRSLNSYIMEKARHQTHTSHMDLVETN